MNPSTSAGLLRARDGRKARVTEGELFFDLIYAFAITQLSHLLLHHPGPEGALARRGKRLSRRHRPPSAFSART